jgi:hypothetical protein
MTRSLRESADQLLVGSGPFEGRVFRCAAQASPQTPAQLALARARAAWLADRDLQTLRTAGMPLRERTWPRAQALSIDQHDRAAAADGLCAERCPCRSQRIPRQLPPSARGAQRHLRNQRRTAAAARASRLDGPRCRRPRLHQGGRHPRRYDRILSCRRRLAVRTGRGRQ